MWGNSEYLIRIDKNGLWPWKKLGQLLRLDMVIQEVKYKI